MAVKNKEIENIETPSIDKPKIELPKEVIINSLQILDKSVSTNNLYSFTYLHRHHPSNFVKLDTTQVVVIKGLKTERSSNLKVAQKTLFKLYKVVIQIKSVLTFIKVWVIPILFG